MAEAIFRREGNRYLPTDLADSPWADDLVHGGPSAGLLAHAIGRFAGIESLHVSRLMVDLFRPVPREPLSVTTRTTRAGRRLDAVEASLLAGEVEVCRASGLLLQLSEGAVAEPVGVVAAPAWSETVATTSLGGAQRTSTEPPRREGFHTADFTNALAGIGLGPTRVGFINADSTIYLQRLPVGEWICREVARPLEPHGLGVARATLFDRKGAIGAAGQAILANPVR